MAALYALVDMRTLANMQGRPAPKLVDATDTLALFHKLMEKGADPNASSSGTIIGRHHGQGDPLLSEGATPLHRAAKSVDVEMMRLLLEGGADPLAAKADGTTPLMLAAGGQVPRSAGLSPVASAELVVSAVRLLLDRGGDPECVQPVRPDRPSLRGGTWRRCLGHPAAPHAGRGTGASRPAGTDGPRSPRPGRRVGAPPTRTANGWCLCCAI